MIVPLAFHQIGIEFDACLIKYLCDKRCFKRLSHIQRKHPD